MYSMSDNIKFTSYNDTNKVVNELFESLLLIYQDNLETLIRGTNFIFDSVQLMYYKCHKVNFKPGGSSIHSPDWIKYKNTTINQEMKMIKVFNTQR